MSWSRLLQRTFLGSLMFKFDYSPAHLSLNFSFPGSNPMAQWVWFTSSFAFNLVSAGRANHCRKHFQRERTTTASLSEFQIFSKHLMASPQFLTYVNENKSNNIKHKALLLHFISAGRVKFVLYIPDCEFVHFCVDTVVLKV